MYKVKNLTNSPHRITTADGGFGVLPARGEEDFDIHPRMVQPYSSLGYLKLTKLEVAGKSDNKPEPEVVKNVQVTEAQPADIDDEAAQKESLIAELAELGVKADKRSSVEKLQEKLDEALAK